MAAAQEDGVALLEFVVTNMQDGWDKPTQGAYVGGRGREERGKGLYFILLRRLVFNSAL